MSFKKAKKKRMSVLFDLDNVKAGMVEQDSVFADIREHLAALQKVDIKQMMNANATVSPLQEHEVLQILACKLTVKRLDSLKFAIQHVPNNIHRTIDGIPLRLTYIRKIFNALSSTHCGDTDLSIEDIGDYVKFIETHCRSFLSKQDNMDDIWTLTKKENIPFNRFLTPPIRTCLRCQKLLTMQNYPAKVKIFTTDGPIPCSKISLECRNCSCVYGVCNFSDKLGTHFYPEEMGVDVVEVSNVTYIDLKSYKWFPSLR